MRTRAICASLLFLLSTLFLPSPAAGSPQKPAAPEPMEIELSLTQEANAEGCAGGHLTLEGRGELRAQPGRGPAVVFEGQVPLSKVSAENYTCNTPDGKPAVRYAFPSARGASVHVTVGIQPGVNESLVLSGLLGTCQLTVYGPDGAPQPKMDLEHDVGAATLAGSVSPPFSFTPEELQQGFSRTFTITYADTDSFSTCIQGGGGQLNFTLRYKAGPTLRILKPEAEDEVVFRDGKLVIHAEAEVTPQKFASEVTWEMDEIGGSQRSIEPTRGAKTTITFTGLPSDNGQFGEKTLTARVRGQEDSVRIKIFFSRDARDNPGGQDPNWFYYWRQGVVEGLERFQYRPGGSLFNPNTGELFVSDEAAGQLAGGSVSLTKGKKAGCIRSISLAETEGVESAARVVAHELEHERLAKQAGRSIAADRDADLVADQVEATSPYCLDPMNENTHGINVDDGASGDSEVLAIAAEAKSKGRAKRNLDWAAPGAQSKKTQ